MRRWWIGLIVALASLAVASHAQAARVVADERAYIAPRLDAAGQLEIGVLRLPYGSNEEAWTSAEESVIALGAASETTVPDWMAELPGFTDALGAAGDTVWTSAGEATEGEERGVASVGYTRALLGRQQADGTYLLKNPDGSSGTLRGVSRADGTGRAVQFWALPPGEEEAWPADGQIIYDSADGGPLEYWSQGSGYRSTSLEPFQWGFRESGFYCIDFEVRAVLADGTQVGDRRAIAVAVGDVDPEKAPVCELADSAQTTTSLSVAPAGQAQAGEAVSLRAEVTPFGATGTVQFYDRRRGQAELPVGDPVAVTGGTAQLSTSSLARGHHELRAVFTPSADSGLASSESAVGELGIYAPDAYVYWHGHGDLSAVSDADGLKLRMRIDEVDHNNQRVFKRVDETVLDVPDAAKVTIPDPSYGFVAPAGSEVWILPMSSLEGVPYLGMASEELQDDLFQRYTTLQLRGVTALDGGPAPGEIVVYNSNSGDRPMLSTRHGLPDALRMLARSSGHWHTNWAFTGPGVYCVAFAATNRLAAGGVPVSDEQVLTVVVGDQVDPYATPTCKQLGVRPAGSSQKPTEAPAGSRLVLDTEEDEGGREGYAELTPELRAGELDVRLVEGDPAGPGTAYDPDETIVRLGPSTRVPLRDGDAVGARSPWAAPSENTLVYALSDELTRRRYALGWDTTHITPGSLAADIKWQLTGVEGPGEFVMHDEWGQRRGSALFSTRPGYGADSYDLWPGRRDTGTWLFSEPGVYCVGMRWSAPLAGGKSTTVEKTLTFVVGETPADAVTPCADGGEPTPGGADAEAGDDTSAPALAGGPAAGSPAAGATRSVVIHPHRKIHLAKGRRLVSLATLGCPAGGAMCRVVAPRRVSATVGRERLGVRILVPRWIKSGAEVSLRGRLPRYVGSRFGHRTIRLSVRVEVVADGMKSVRRLRSAIRGVSSP